MVFAVVLLVGGALLVASVGIKPKTPGRFLSVLGRIIRGLLGGALLIIGIAGVIVEGSRQAEPEVVAEASEQAESEATTEGSKRTEPEVVIEPGEGESSADSESTATTTSDGTQSPEAEPEPVELQVEEGDEHLAAAEDEESDSEKNDELFRFVQSLLDGTLEPDETYEDDENALTLSTWYLSEDVQSASVAYLSAVQDDSAAWWLTLHLPTATADEYFAVESSKPMPVRDYERVFGPLGLGLVDTLTAPNGEVINIHYKTAAFIQKHEPEKYWLLEEENPTIVGGSRLFNACKELIRSDLLAPSTAKFPGFLEMLDVRTDVESDGSTSWSSWVDSQNTFGTMIRSHFRCRLDRPTGMLTVDFR